MDEDEWEEIEVFMNNDVEADTAVVIQMAASMLNGEGEVTFLRAMSLPISTVASTMTMAASMIAGLAEHLAEHEGRSPEQILLELRNWMNDGEEDG